MSEKSSDISIAIQARSNAQHHLWEHETAEQRLVRFGRLQQASLKLLRSSPEGLRHFLRRNMTSRRVEVINGMWRPISAHRGAGEA
jgi:hypothetical protein